MKIEKALSFYMEILDATGQIIEKKDISDRLLDQTVTLVSCDSRQVIPGTFFICKGAHFNVDFLKSARENGAICYISENIYEEVDLPCIQVDNIRLPMALLSDSFYGHPSAKLHVTGITGTKGKSSTAYFIKSILDEYMLTEKGKRSGIISSIDTYDGVIEFESHLTTPEPLDLEKHLDNALSTGTDYVTMEVSSQALKYNRVTNVALETAVFLNIGTDHISPAEHKDFEDYFSSKLLIFKQCKNAVINMDSDHTDRIISTAKNSGARLVTFSANDKNADIYGSDIRAEDNGSHFHVKGMGLNQDFRINIPGRFNVDNALAAITVCMIYQIPVNYIEEGLKKATVPGRMEVFQSKDKKITAIVDYAHNQMSFEALFKAVKEDYPEHKILAVFGCPGKKAYARREQLAKASGEACDYVYITEEDAGEEPVLDISREIATNVEKTGCPHEIILDRGEAIRAALSYKDTPLVACITGKGRETRQKRGIEYIECPSDVDYVTEFISEYDAGTK